MGWALAAYRAVGAEGVLKRLPVACRRAAFPQPDELLARGGAPPAALVPKLHMLIGLFCIP